MATDVLLRPLGDLIVSFDHLREPVKETERRTGPYPYYGASGIVDHVDSYRFDGDYLLIAEDGENLRTQQTPIAFLASGKFWANNHAHVVRANHTSDTRYLMYAVRSVNIRAYLTGSTMPKLTAGNLVRVSIPYRPLPEQRAIASILGALDDKIDLNGKMSATLEAISRALFKSWFVDFNPVSAKAEGNDPGMPQEIATLFPDSFDASLPRGWSKSSIYEIADVTYGAAFASSSFNDKGEGMPLIRIRDLRSQTPSIWTTEEHPRGYLVQPGDLLVGMDGEFKPYMWCGDPGWMNQRICCFRPKRAASRAYVHFVIEGLLADVERSETATTVIHLGKSDIDLFRVLEPPEPVLESYAKAADELETRILIARQESHTLAALRDALLPKLINGELRVGNP